MVRIVDDRATELRRRAEYCAQWAQVTPDPAERRLFEEKSRALLALAENEDWLTGKRLTDIDNALSASNENFANFVRLGPLTSPSQQAAE